MSRINCINPSRLNDKALGAEYRELPRVFRLVKLAIVRGEKPDDSRNPKSYTMGPGHIRFFYNKLGWLVHRYAMVVEECRRRGRQVNFPDVNKLIEGIPEEWMGGWKVTDKAKAINLKRLYERNAVK